MRKSTSRTTRQEEPSRRRIGLSRFQYHQCTTNKVFHHNQSPGQPEQTAAILGLDLYLDDCRLPYNHPSFKTRLRTDLTLRLGQPFGWQRAIVHVTTMAQLNTNLQPTRASQIPRALAGGAEQGSAQTEKKKKQLAKKGIRNTALQGETK